MSGAIPPLPQYAFMAWCLVEHRDNFYLRITRRMRWAGHVQRMEEMKNAYNILVGKPEGKRPLGRPRHRWEGNIRTNLRE
jgi:hypothetical protein